MPLVTFVATQSNIIRVIKYHALGGKLIQTGDHKGMLSPSSTGTQLSIWLVHYEDWHKSTAFVGLPVMPAGKGILVPKKFINGFLKNYVKFVHGTHFPELTGHDVFIPPRRAAE